METWACCLYKFGARVQPLHARGRKRASFAEAGWAGGVRGQKVHHSVDVRAAWWGVTVDEATDDEDVVIDLGIGRAASAGGGLDREGTEGA